MSEDARLPAGAQDAALGEVAALALKAARGAGYVWGIAEEAADAVRVLSAFGVPGADLLAALLDEQAFGGNPLAAGIGVSDRAAEVCTQGAEAFLPLASPALFLPFVLRVAALQGRAFRVTGGDMDVVCLPERALSGVIVDTHRAVVLTVVPLAEPWPSPLPRVSRAIVSAQTWDRLHVWAAKTYAPATDASRASGAGAADDADD